MLPICPTGLWIRQRTKQGAERTVKVRRVQCIWLYDKVSPQAAAGCVCTLDTAVRTDTEYFDFGNRVLRPEERDRFSPDVPFHYTEQESSAEGYFAWPVVCVAHTTQDRHGSSHGVRERQRREAVKFNFDFFSKRERVAPLMNLLAMRTLGEVSAASTTSTPLRTAVMMAYIPTTLAPRARKARTTSFSEKYSCLECIHSHR